MPVVASDPVGWYQVLPYRLAKASLFFRGTVSHIPGVATRHSKEGHYCRLLENYRQEAYTVC